MVNDFIIEPPPISALLGCTFCRVHAVIIATRKLLEVEFWVVVLFMKLAAIVGVEGLFAASTPAADDLSRWLG